jgi:deoxyribodipyrimidine photo-lyase
VSSEPPVIVWFRQDLRLIDNPALHAAAESGHRILPVYVLDDAAAGDWAMGAASRWWLHQSLRALDGDLDGTLRCFRGSAESVLPKLASDTGARTLYMNRCIEPWRRECDARVARELASRGIVLETFRDVTLFDPERAMKADGTPYRVFTPFYRKACLQGSEPPREPMSRPSRLATYRLEREAPIDALGLEPAIPWYRRMQREWRPGEAGAHERLERFLDAGLDGYAEGRDRPDLAHVSRLSPHLHFGEISPNQVWHSVLPLGSDPTLSRDVDVFLSELGWREFSSYLLWHWPSLPTENLQSRFDRFPWASDPESLERWQQGCTGYPIVDAGMRELWQTGYMHNRVRMIAGSFLVKNLLLHWQHGARWFWDTLVDADLANNSASWQWVSGSGADAAPYFRIFNPVTQGKKFDPHGDYVRSFVPELRDLPDADIHTPWTAAPSARKNLDYPSPLVALKPSRERALASFKAISNEVRT